MDHDRSPTASVPGDDQESGPLLASGLVPAVGHDRWAPASGALPVADHGWASVSAPVADQGRESFDAAPAAHGAGEDGAAWAPRRGLLPGSGWSAKDRPAKNWSAAA
ncbi:hypothetical protein [Actinoplanes sp. HUAS TT8]|uniref:hypothetical protein n=1 Tax=Actinoplanes sp. HUAS TT8 TaxID=3447453 RepID=UPI003F526B20